MENYKATWFYQNYKAKIKKCRIDNLCGINFGLINQVKIATLHLCSSENHQSLSSINSFLARISIISFGRDSA